MSTTLQVIYWRDIPAQVIAKSGRDVHRVALDDRFQEAIDRAATRAGLIGTDEYLAEWRKEQTSVDESPSAAAAGEASRLEASFSDAALEACVRNLARLP